MICEHNLTKFKNKKSISNHKRWCEQKINEIIFKQKLRKSKLGKKNPQWKGNKIGYIGLHVFIGRNWNRPMYCDMCKKQSKVDAANISGKYLRTKSDFEWLCRRCHMIKDGRLNKLHPYKNYEYLRTMS